MKRKAALITTAVVTCLLMVLRLMATRIGTFSVGPLTYNDCLIVLAFIAIAVIVFLSFSKKATVVQPGMTKIGIVNGWLCTFCGAVITMSSCLDTFCWIIYDQLPPPCTLISNRIDLVALLCVLLFGVTTGVAMVIQGFSWMAQSDNNKSLRSWLALAPVVWMWFRLARYEISYASTIDISQSFFDCAILVVASIFFLQLARMISGVGGQPKNGLLIFALLTAMISLSGAPADFAAIDDGHPIGMLLVVLVDLIIGCFALCVALLQVFGAPKEEPPVKEKAPVPEAASVAEEEFTQAELDMTWTDPVRDLPPPEPAFEINQVLPTFEMPASPAKPLSPVEKFATVAPAPTAPAAEPKAEPKVVAPTPTPAVTSAPTVAPTAPAKPETTGASNLSIDDILSEIDGF